MAIITVSADSTTLVLNGVAISDLVAGDVLTLVPVNPATAHINASNGGVNINERTDRGVYDLTVRVQRLSGSDAFLTGMLRQSPPVIFNGSLKETFTRDGATFVESWLLESGSITTQPTKTVNDSDGNALSEYVFRFRNALRNL